MDVLLWERVNFHDNPTANMAPILFLTHVFEDSEGRSTIWKFLNPLLYPGAVLCVVPATKK